MTLAAWALLRATPAGAEPLIVANDSFAVTVPDGYLDISERVRNNGFVRPQITLQAKKPKGDFPLIRFQQSPAVGGSQGDKELCLKTAASMAGREGKVRKTAIVRGPTGPTCQMDVLNPQSVALITEINGSKETWLMTCNYADGDAAAEQTCRATLASLQPTKDFGRPATRRR